MIIVINTEAKSSASNEGPLKAHDLAIAKEIFDTLMTQLIETDKKHHLFTGEPKQIPSNA